MNCWNQRFFCFVDLQCIVYKSIFLELSGLEFVKAESKTNGINISVDTTNTRIPVITVNNELERKELNILITTRVTDKLDTYDSKTYTNQAVLSIGGTDYGTAQSSV